MAIAAAARSFDSSKVILLMHVDDISCLPKMSILPSARSEAMIAACLTPSSSGSLPALDKTSSSGVIIPVIRPDAWQLFLSYLAKYMSKLQISAVQIM